MKLKPLHDWAVILPAGAEELTAAGLIIPDTAKEKPQQGVVEAIGPGAFEEEKGRRKKGEKKERRFIPTVVNPGDRVIYERYAGQTYTIDGEERILVRERDILGILEKPLQIPAATSSAERTAVSVRPAPLPVMETRETAAKGKAAKGTARESAREKASKAASKKQTTGKAVKKAAVKKAAKTKKTAPKASKPSTTKKAAPGKTRKKK